MRKHNLFSGRYFCSLNAFSILVIISSTCSLLILVGQ